MGIKLKSETWVRAIHTLDLIKGDGCNNLSPNSVMSRMYHTRDIRMGPSVLYHCPCLSTSAAPPPPNLPSSSYSFHLLHTLFFCEECDAIRCNRCVSVEVSGYYCPNCLFEVPSASVRAEKNRFFITWTHVSSLNIVRCARNCFLCPNCRNTLSVVASDPPDPGDSRLPIAISTVGEPPFFLYCNYCRWDSAEVGITFEKPTGLAGKLHTVSFVFLSCPSPVAENGRFGTRIPGI